MNIEIIQSVLNITVLAVHLLIFVNVELHNLLVGFWLAPDAVIDIVAQHVGVEVMFYGGEQLAGEDTHVLQVLVDAKVSDLLVSIVYCLDVDVLTHLWLE